MMYLLVVTINGSREEQGYYSRLGMVFSRINQLDAMPEIEPNSRPTAFEIILTNKTEEESRG
jgi:hypothetical protein